MTMNRLYTLAEVCALFSINDSTLRRWSARLSIVPAVDPACLSRRMYSEGQVLMLARAHHRVAVIQDVQAGEIEELRRVVLALDRRVREVEAKFSGLDQENEKAAPGS